MSQLPDFNCQADSLQPLCAGLYAQQQNLKSFINVFYLTRPAIEPPASRMPGKIPQPKHYGKLPASHNDFVVLIGRLLK